MIATKNCSVLMKAVNNFAWTSKCVSSLEDMQELVGGNIERVFLPHNIHLWVNEDGIMNGLEINLILIWDNDPKLHQPILGPVFLASEDENGNHTELSESQRAWVANHFRIGHLSNGKKITLIDLCERGDLA